MRRSLSAVRAVALAAAALLAPAAAEAQSNQSFGVSVGFLSVRGEDARIAEDVLVTNLSSLAFNISDFSGATVAGEWLVGLGQNAEAAVGAGFYRQTVPSVYRGWTHDDGSEIFQDLRLRVIPFSATVRFLPFGRGNAVEPYVGAGLAVLNWRYSETGEFVDFSDDTIFRASYVGSGTAVGPLIVVGLRAPVGGEAIAIGGEIRYHRAEGTLPADQDFLNTKIDLGGITSQFTVHFRF
jgi:outer membrane protein W